MLSRPCRPEGKVHQIHTSSVINAPGNTQKSTRFTSTRCETHAWAFCKEPSSKMTSHPKIQPHTSHDASALRPWYPSLPTQPSSSLALGKILELAMVNLKSCSVDDASNFWIFLVLHVEASEATWPTRFHLSWHDIQGVQPWGDPPSPKG